MSSLEAASASEATIVSIDDGGHSAPTCNRVPTPLIYEDCVRKHSKEQRELLYTFYGCGMYKFVFVHLPKTGGTTLHAALRRAVGKDAVSPNFIASKLSDQDAVELDKYTVISGHISIIDVRRYFPDRKILTILREPLDRCVSWYYFARAMRPAIGAATDVFVAQTYGIEEFFNQDLHLIYRNIFNRQVRQLGNHVLNFDLSYAEALENAKQTLRSAAWVGRQETLDTDIADLATIVPNAESAYLQIENRTEGRKGMNELSSNVINRISSLNEYDVALYKFACEEIF